MAKPLAVGDNHGNGMTSLASGAAPSDTSGSFPKKMDKSSGALAIREKRHYITTVRLSIYSVGIRYYEQISGNCCGDGGHGGSDALRS